MPTNFSATRLVETVQLQDKLEKKTNQKCDSCIEGNAIASCCECGGFFLCENCFRVHKQLPATKNHSLLILNQFIQSNVPVLAATKSLLCQRHPQELLQLYCEDCETLVCRNCVLVKHKTHNFNFIDDVIEEEKEHLQDITLVELEEILTSTKKAITGVEEMQAKILTCNDHAIAKLDKTFQEIMEMLNSRKGTFLIEVRQVTEDDLCPLQKQQEDLMILKQKIESCHDFTQKTLRAGTGTEVMSAKKQMIERTKHLQELHNSSPLAPVTKPSTTVYYQMDKMKETVANLGIVIDLNQSCIEDLPKCICVHKPVSIQVVLKGTKGQPICHAIKAITAQVTLSSVNGSLVTSFVLYSVKFTPTKPNGHILSIKINDNHISGSPVELATATVKKLAASKIQSPIVSKSEWTDVKVSNYKAESYPYVIGSSETKYGSEQADIEIHDQLFILYQY